MIFFGGLEVLTEILISPPRCGSATDGKAG